MRRGADDAQRVPRPAARHARPGERSTSTVLNGTGTAGQAADAAGALGEIGFNVVDVDSYPTEDVGRTTVLLRLLRRRRPRDGWPPTSPAAPRSCRTTTLASSEVVLVTGQRLHDHPRSAGPQGLGRRPAHHDVHHGAELHEHDGSRRDHHVLDGRRPRRPR